MSGILYGTGVGPGESGLLTLKAVRIIQASDLIVVPVSAEDFRRPCLLEEESIHLKRCKAYQIVREEVPKIREKPVLGLPMPMRKEKEALKKIHDEGAKQVEAYLNQGKQPASYGIEEGLTLPGTKILMKAGKKMPVIKDMLRESGEWFAMVENCGMEGERIYENPDDVPDHSSYYSLIVIKEGS